MFNEKVRNQSPGTFVTIIILRKSPIELQKNYLSQRSMFKKVI